jgi:hypothetical protein
VYKKYLNGGLPRQDAEIKALGSLMVLQKVSLMVLQKEPPVARCLDYQLFQPLF